MRVEVEAGSSSRGTLVARPEFAQLAALFVLATQSRRTSHLARIQHCREFPARFTQRVQAVIGRQLPLIDDTLGPCGCWKPQLCWKAQLCRGGSYPASSASAVRPEHVETPDVLKVISVGRGSQPVVPAERMEKLKV